MRYVELRRHTDNDGDALTPDGISAAEAIGRDRLNPPYAAFVSTGAARATQMLKILRRAAGQEEAPIIEANSLRSSSRTVGGRRPAPQARVRTWRPCGSSTQSWWRRSPRCSVWPSERWSTTCRTEDGRSSSGTARHTRRPSSGSPGCWFRPWGGTGCPVDRAPRDVHRGATALNTAPEEVLMGVRCHRLPVVARPS